MPLRARAVSVNLCGGGSGRQRQREEAASPGPCKRKSWALWWCCASLRNDGLRSGLSLLPGGAQREGYPERPREDQQYIVEHEDFRIAAVCLSIAVLQVSDRGATRTEESSSVNGKMTYKLYWESGPVASATCTRLSASWPTSGLLRSVSRKISSLEPRVSFSNSEGRYCTMVWQKIRSVSHFFQPPAIDKASEVKRKKSMLIKWRVDWREIESTHYVTIISARNTGTSTVFRAPFSTTFRWRIFLKPTGID